MHNKGHLLPPNYKKSTHNPSYFEILIVEVAHLFSQWTKKFEKDCVEFLW